MRLSLFNHIFWRVIALLGLVWLALLFLLQIHMQRSLVEAWQNDLQQDARWLSRHWGQSQSPQEFALIWGATHDAVQLQIYDSKGVLVADSWRQYAQNSIAELGDLSEKMSMILYDSETGEVLTNHGHVNVDLVKPNAKLRTIVGKSPIRLGKKTPNMEVGEFVLKRTLDVSSMSSPQMFIYTALGLFVLTALVLWPLIRSVTRSLGQVSDLANRVSEGHYGETLAEKGNRDIVGLIVAFNEMSGRLKLAEQKNERLLSDVSHELRTPLARFIALVDTIERHPDEVGNLSKKVKTEVDLMDRLIGDILESSKFEGRIGTLQRQDVDFSEWVEQSCVRLKAQAKKSNVEFSYIFETGSGSINIDAQRMMQVLGNVIENAIKAVENKNDKKITFSTSEDKEQWFIRISDNGVGVDEAAVPYLFDRFYRVDRGRTRQRGGAGLGLSISRAIIRAHGGEILFSSQLDVGSEVLIRLPKPK